MSLAIDPTRATEGHWFPVSPVSRVKVTHYNNKKFMARIRAEVVKLGLPPGQDATDEQKTAITCTAMGATVLVDWQGFELNGEPFPYTEENAIKLLSAKGMEAFREQISEFSMNSAAFRDSELEDGIKKSLGG